MAGIGRHAEEESLALKNALSSANSRLSKLESLEAEAVSRAMEIQVGHIIAVQPRRHTYIDIWNACVCISLCYYHVLVDSTAAGVRCAVFVVCLFFS